MEEKVLLTVDNSNLVTQPATCKSELEEFDIYFAKSDDDTGDHHQLELVYDHTFKIGPDIQDQIALYLASKGSYCRFRIRWDDLTFDTGFGAIVEALHVSDIARAYNAQWATIGYISRQVSHHFTIKMGERDILDMLAEKVNIETKYGSPAVGITAVYQGASMHVSESKYPERRTNSNLAIIAANALIAKMISLCANSDSFDRVIKEQMLEPGYLLAYMLAGGTEVAKVHKVICDLRNQTE